MGGLFLVFTVLVGLAFAQQVTVPPIPEEYKCIKARMDYWMRNTAVFNNGMDPVYHWETYGWNGTTPSVWRYELCVGEDRVYLEDDKCHCDAAKKEFIASHPAAKNADDTFEYYKQTYTPYSLWHCEMCPGIFSNNLPFPKTGILAECTCVAARYDYWMRYPEVYTSNLDSVYHFSKKYLQTEWDCTLCNADSLFINNTKFRCPVAETLYAVSYPGSKYYYDVFDHYAISYVPLGNIWHFELCPETDVLPTSCECIAARVNYWETYPETQGVDAVYHYENGGFRTNSWNCALCDVSPVYISDTAAQCDAAAAQYAATYTSAGSTPFVYYLKHSNTVWHAELCPGTIPLQPLQLPASLPQSCTCMAARDMYLTVNVEVEQIPMDPVYHYITIGAAEGRNWPCQLCNATSTYIQDSQYRCSKAKEIYLDMYEGAEFYNDPFVHYWNHFLTTGVTWNADECVGRTRPTLTPTLPPFSRDSGCLQARNDYWARNADVLAADVDPVYHYLNQAGRSARKWNSALCDSNPLYIEVGGVCNCTAAAARYQASHPDVTGDPFLHFLNGLAPYAWHCELCPIHPNIPAESASCLAASADYVYRYPEAQKFDPLYHFTWFGYYKGHTWDGARCDVAPHYATDSVCNCSAAAVEFGSALDYPSGDEYFSMYHSSRIIGSAWRCDLCTTNEEDPSSSLTCNCTSARSLYSAQHPSVSIDPWVHYTTIGKSQGLSWNCAICNDTCPGRYGPNILSHASQAGLFSANQDVLIPRGCSVGIEGAFALRARNISVQGTLWCSDLGAGTRASIYAAKVWLYGIFECGTDSAPFAGTLNITLYGTRPIPGQEQGDRVGGDKSIAVLSHSKLSFHGKKSVSWTRLAATAAVGASQVQVEDDVDWVPGDQIVIATTANYNRANTEIAPISNEVRTITSVQGKTLTLSAPLQYEHLSLVYELDFFGLSVKKKAEVGLLSQRNIIFQGAEDTLIDGYGAHIMVTRGGRAYVSGVQFFRAGQKATLARYPFHWHMLGDIPSGQYIKNSSVSYSNNRCITIHGTNNSLVANNICFNFIGHGYFLEDGVETGNTITNNLGILAIRPLKSQALIPSDIFDGTFATGPSVFWISNPNNTLTNNVAVSSPGTGFWIQPEPTASGPHSGLGYNPQQAPFGFIQNNHAHSLLEGFTTCPIAGGSTGSTNWDQKWVIDRVSVYGNQIGIWPCGASQNWTNLVISDCVLGMQVPNVQYFTNAAYINHLNGSQPPNTLGSAINLYDSGWSMTNAYFENYDIPHTHSIFRVSGGVNYNPHTRISGVVLRNTPSLYGDPGNGTHPYWTLNGQYGYVVNDLDGSLTGAKGGGVALTPDHPQILTPLCYRQKEGYFGHVCPYRYGESRLFYDQVNLPPATIDKFNFKNRSYMPSSPAVFFPTPNTNFHWTAFLNSDFVHVFVMPISPSRLYSIQLANYVLQGDTTAIEFHNVGSSDSYVTNAFAASSCQEVWENTTLQSYYWNASFNIFCVRTVATERTITGDYQNKYIALSLLSGNDASELPTGAPFDYYLPYNQTCMKARLQYWQDYKDVFNANQDPVYHFQKNGYTNRKWPGHLCTNPSTDLYIENERACNCSAAITKFLVDFPSINRVPDAYKYYVLYRYYRGQAYHCELCPSVPPDTPTDPPTDRPTDSPTTRPSRLTETCKCMAARLQYWKDYPEVFDADLDPVYHYETSGYLTNSWNCGLCDKDPIFIQDPIARCDAAKAAYLQKYPAAGKQPDPFVDYLENYMSSGNAWHAELCPGVGGGSSTPPPSSVDDNSEGKSIVLEVSLVAVACIGLAVGLVAYLWVRKKKSETRGIWKALDQDDVDADGAEMISHRSSEN